MTRGRLPIAATTEHRADTNNDGIHDETRVCDPGTPQI